MTNVMTMGRDQFVNWCAQRCDENADQNIQRLAITMLRLYRQSTPQTLRAGRLIDIAGLEPKDYGGWWSDVPIPTPTEGGGDE
jgi:hypothetical protein